MWKTLKNIVYSLIFRERVNIYPDGSLDGKIVVITGASRGIGRSTAEILLARRAIVVCIARDDKVLRRVFRKYDRARIMALDVTRMADCETAAKRILEDLGKIDVLINIAGVFERMTLTSRSLDGAYRMFSVNCMGVINMCRAFAGAFRKQKSGLIINMGSYISRSSRIEPGRAIYAATKYAVEGLSRGLGDEMAGWGVRVTCLMPATVKTFRTVTPNAYISPYRIGHIIADIITHEHLLVESVTLKPVSHI